ncbi:MAG: hypothetical protein JKY71_00705 [Alphaproteobacteria bacterium]|nr:hypothetical protein [Alphaproteobacteria bacterium]
MLGGLLSLLAGLTKADRIARGRLYPDKKGYSFPKRKRRIDILIEEQERKEAEEKLAKSE